MPRGAMSDRRTVSEVPHAATVRLPEAMAVHDAAQLAAMHTLEAVVVLDANGEVRGAVLASVLMRLADRVPAAPLRLVPLLTCLSVPADAKVAQTLDAMTRVGASAALVHHDRGDPVLVTQERLLSVA